MARKIREKTFPHRPGMLPGINQIQESGDAGPGMSMKTKADKHAM